MERRMAGQRVRAECREENQQKERDPFTCSLRVCSSVQTQSLLLVKHDEAVSV